MGQFSGRGNCFMYVPCVSIAKTLGAKRVSKRSYEWLTQHPIVSHVVTDKEAVTASIKFAGICI